MEKTARKKSSNKFVQIVKLHKKKLVILAFLAIMIYIIYLVVRLIINPTDTVYVEMGQIQEEETATGYIIRDETVLKGEKYKNGIEQIKTEGEKVAKGDANKIFIPFEATATLSSLGAIKEVFADEAKKSKK